MPEMSVVRFTESDVIVASSYYHLFNAGDATGYNLQVDDPNGNPIFKNANSSPVVNNMGAYASHTDGNVYFRYSSSDNTYSLNTLWENDSHDTPTRVSGVDGYYTWNAEQSIFIMRGVQAQ